MPRSKQQLLLLILLFLLLLLRLSGRRRWLFDVDAIHSNTYVFYSKRIACSCPCDKIHVIEHSAASQTVTNQPIWQHLKSNYPRTHIHLSNYHPLPIVFPPKLADFLFYLFGLPGHSAWKSTFWSRSVSNLIYLSFTYLKYYFKFHVYPSMVQCL